MGGGSDVQSGRQPAIFLPFFSGVIVLATNIYVGNLSWSTTDADLRSLFAQYGEVASVQNF